MSIDRFRFDKVPGGALAILGIWAICASITWAYEHPYQPHASHRGYLGPIKTVKETILGPIDKNDKYINSTPPVYRLTQFNEKGYMASETTYKEDGAVRSILQYQYDKDGMLIESLWMKGDRTVTLKSVFHYDDKKRVVLRALFRADGAPDMRSTFTFDPKERRCRLHMFSGPDDPSPVWEDFYYDAKDHLVKSIWYQDDGTLFSTNVYRYDKKGQRVGNSGYKADGSLHYKNKYGARGEYLNRTYYKPNGDINFKYLYEYNYDKRGNWTRMILSKVVIKDGKEVMESREAKLRIIKYHKPSAK